MRESFSLDILLSLQETEWMLGLTCSVVHNSVLSITKEKSKKLK